MIKYAFLTFLISLCVNLDGIARTVLAAECASLVRGGLIPGLYGLSHMIPDDDNVVNRVIVAPDAIFIGCEGNKMSGSHSSLARIDGGFVQFRSHAREIGSSPLLESGSGWSALGGLKKTGAAAMWNARVVAYLGSDLFLLSAECAENFPDAVDEVNTPLQILLFDAKAASFKIIARHRRGSRVESIRWFSKERVLLAEEMDVGEDSVVVQESRRARCFRTTDWSDVTVNDVPAIRNWYRRFSVSQPTPLPSLVNTERVHLRINGPDWRHPFVTDLHETALPVRCFPLTKKLFVVSNECETRLVTEDRNYSLTLPRMSAFDVDYERRLVFLRFRNAGNDDRMQYWVLDVNENAKAAKYDLDASDI